MSEIKREQNKLAVFEHLPSCKDEVSVEEPALTKGGFKRAYSPTSEVGLVIDDEDETIVVRFFLACGFLCVVTEWSIV